MISKTNILKKCDNYLSKKRTFAFRVCKLIKDEYFNDALSSHELVHLLNEGPGKKIKPSNLSAAMVPLLEDDIIQIKNIKEGNNKGKYWFPGFIDKKDAEKKITAGSAINNVLFFTGKDSWTDPNKNFPKVIELLQGDLCIVDPFYGNGTFYVLEKFGKNQKIKFLSCQLGTEEQNNSTQFERNLKRFKNEFKNIEMRKYDKKYELHDRYIIAENGLVIVGHGIKDLADKESFVVFLEKALVEKFLPVLKKAFEQRWKKSNNLK